MYERGHEMKFNDRKFFAAIQGIDLEENVESEVDVIKRRAEARALGLTEEQYELQEFFVIEDDDD